MGQCCLHLATWLLWPVDSSHGCHGPLTAVSPSCQLSVLSVLALPRRSCLQARCTSPRPTSCCSWWHPGPRSTGRCAARTALQISVLLQHSFWRPCCKATWQLYQPASRCCLPLQHGMQCPHVLRSRFPWSSWLADHRYTSLCLPYLHGSPPPSSSTASSPASAGPGPPSLCATRWGQLVTCGL